MFILKINFKGGIVSPGDLFNILVAAEKSGIREVRFGLRQQMFIESEYLATIASIEKELQEQGIAFERNSDKYPNVVSSYPAEEVFITSTWLKEGVYKDILDEIDYQPELKINISNNNQSFTPLLTGNINWITSTQPHFWHLFIRFPKTNIVFEWKDLVYTNDVVRMSKKIEQVIQGNKDRYCDNRTVNGEELYQRVMVEKYSTIPAVKPAVLPMFNLPYYEGLNSYNGKYWLGIYRRDEWFTIEFLKDICRLCLQLKIGQIGASPWKSLIIKGIEEKDRKLWNHILSKYQINIRHAANELNFQVEDNCKEGLSLKNFLVKHLNNNDVRTFGICIGIKTRKKSEVFSSILVRRRPLLSFGSKGIIYVYDIMCAKDFNPNERTGAVISSGNPKFLVPEQLRRAILKFYEHQAQVSQVKDRQEVPRPNQELPQQKAGYYQCRHCQTIYDEEAGEPTNGIPPGTLFESLPETYSCSLCEAGKQDFIKVNRMLAEERVA